MPSRNVHSIARHRFQKSSNERKRKKPVLSCLCHLIQTGTVLKAFEAQECGGPRLLCYLPLEQPWWPAPAPVDGISELMC